PPFVLRLLQDPGVEFQPAQLPVQEQLRLTHGIDHPTPGGAGRQWNYVHLNRIFAKVRGGLPSPSGYSTVSTQFCVPKGLSTRRVASGSSTQAPSARRRYW